MKQFFKDALDFATKKAVSEKQRKEIRDNFKDIIKSLERSKKNGRKTKAI